MTDSKSYGIGSGAALRKPDMRREQRRRREERLTTIDWALTVAIILLILAIGGMIGYAGRIYHETPEPVRRVIIQPTAAERRYYEARYRVHGIWVSIEEPGIKPYFYRDGKKGKL